MVRGGLRGVGAEVERLVKVRVIKALRRGQVDPVGVVGTWAWIVAVEDLGVLGRREKGSTWQRLRMGLCARHVFRSTLTHACNYMTKTYTEGHNTSTTHRHICQQDINE